MAEGIGLDVTVAVPVEVAVLDFVEIGLGDAVVEGEGFAVGDEISVSGIIFSGKRV